MKKKIESLYKLSPCFSGHEFQTKKQYLHYKHYINSVTESLFILQLPSAILETDCRSIKKERKDLKLLNGSPTALVVGKNKIETMVMALFYELYKKTLRPKNMHEMKVSLNPPMLIIQMKELTLLSLAHRILVLPFLNKWVSSGDVCCFSAS